MRRLMWFTLGFACACLLTVYLLPEGWLPWIALIAAGAFPVLRLRRSGRRTLRVRAAPASGPSPCRLLPVSCCLLGLTIGLLWCWGYEALVLSPAREAEGRQEQLTAELCGYPRQTGYGHWADAYVTVSGRRVKTRLYLYGPLPELEPGDRVTGSFTLRRADRSADGDVYLGLQAAGILLTGSGRVTAAADGGAPFRYFPVRWSKAVFDRLGALIPADAAGLPQAMLTGIRDGLSEPVRVDLSTAGASHIVAVSGLHVSMLTAVLFLLLGRGKRSVFLGLPLLALFVLMTGASPSVVRAALMLGLMLLAPLAGEENDPPTSLALAGLLILLANPWAAANVSFQLSFGAVAGLLLVTRPLLQALLALPRVRRLTDWQGPKRWPRLPRTLLVRLTRRSLQWLCTGVSATLGALIFTAPIAAAVYGSMPVYAVLTNLFVLPLATLCLTGGLAVLALGLVSTTLGSWAGWVLAWPVRAIFAVCRFTARLPGHTLWMDGFGVGFLVFAYVLILLLVLLRQRRVGVPLLCLLAGLAACVGLQGLDAASGAFIITVLDVGQGQCVCMRSGGFTAVVDCGGSGSSAGGRAAQWLDRQGADRLDVLILTHYDRDHVNGAAALLARVPVDAVWLPETDFDPESRAEVEEAALAAGAELRSVTADTTLPFPGGTLQIFAPVSDRNDNAACVSVLYSAGEYDMLITGDLDAAGEYALLERHALPRVELYVAGHHGSARSSTEALLETIRPETVFVSVGRNSYGLPSAAALDRFAAVGARVLRTDECGDLSIRR